MCLSAEYIWKNAHYSFSEFLTQRAMHSVKLSDERKVFRQSRNSLAVYKVQVIRFLESVRILVSCYGVFHLALVSADKAKISHNHTLHRERISCPLDLCAFEKVSDGLIIS